MTPRAREGEIYKSTGGTAGASMLERDCGVEQRKQKREQKIHKKAPQGSSQITHSQESASSGGWKKYWSFRKFSTTRPNDPPSLPKSTLKTRGKEPLKSRHLRRGCKGRWASNNHRKKGGDRPDLPCEKMGKVYQYVSQTKKATTESYKQGKNRSVRSLSCKDLAKGGLRNWG